MTSSRCLLVRARAHRSVPLAATLLGMALLVAACSNDSAGPAADTTTTADENAARSTTSTTSADETKRQEVIDALEAADDAFDEAASIPDPDYPLERTHTEAMLVQSREIIESLAADGLVIEYPVDSQAATTVTSVRFEEQDGEEAAILTECTVDDGRRVRQATGAVVAGGGVSTVWSTAVMVEGGGVWKLAELRQDERRDGVAECPDDG